MALQLSSLYQSPLLLLPTEVRRPARHPWAHLMAALVVAGAQACVGSLGVHLQRCKSARPFGQLLCFSRFNWPTTHACS